MKDIKDYKGKKYAIQCKTQEEWNKIAKLLDYKNNPDNWDKFKENSCWNAQHYFWDNVSFYQKEGYEILQASDFLQSTFKFNIGDIVKTNGKGIEGHDLTFNDNCPSNKYSNSDSEVVERNVNTNGKNVYKIKFSWGTHGNWITEEGLELVVKQETNTIPEYVECINKRSDCNDYTIGKIYKVENGSIRTDSGYLASNKLTKDLLNYYDDYDFKPSTKEAYENQQLMNKHNLVVGKYYTFESSSKITYWFRFKEIKNDLLYCSGFRNDYSYKIWEERKADLIYIKNETFKEVTEQEAKGIEEKEEKWIPKVGEWVVWLNSSLNIAYKVIKLNSDSFFVESDGEEFRYIKPIKELCRKALPHEIPNNILDSGIQCYKYKDEFTQDYTYSNWSTFDGIYKQIQSSNSSTPTTITIKDRTKKEEKPLTKTRTKLTFLKPKSITI